MADRTLEELKVERLAIAPQRFQRALMIALPYLIVLMSLGIVFLTTRLAATTKEVLQTSAYTRVSNCIVAKSADPSFTQDEIERCYIQVEKNTGQSLERFDFQTKGEN